MASDFKEQCSTSNIQQPVPAEPLPDENEEWNVDNWNNEVFKFEQNSLIKNKLGLVVNKRYQIVQRIDAGAFGSTYIGEDLKNNRQRVAVKFDTGKSEWKKAKKAENHLKYEFEVYKSALYEDGFERVDGFAQVYWFGYQFGHNILVMELLGASVASLFTFCDRKFGWKTVLSLAQQMIHRIRHIHQRGFIHRDLKPENFLMGLGKKETTCYLIDFGLARRYRFRHPEDRTLKHIPFRRGRSFIGTAKYASVNSHRSVELSRRDDLESIGYILIELINGYLPWKNICRRNQNNKHQTYMRIRAAKEQSNWQEICTPMADYMDYCRSLQFAEEPDYEKLLDVLRSRLIEEQNSIVLPRTISTQKCDACRALAQDAARDIRLKIERIEEENGSSLPTEARSNNTQTEKIDPPPTNSTDPLPTTELLTIELNNLKTTSPDSDNPKQPSYESPPQPFSLVPKLSQSSVDNFSPHSSLENLKSNLSANVELGLLAVKKANSEAATEEDVDSIKSCKNCRQRQSWLEDEVIGENAKLSWQIWRDSTPETKFDYENRFNWTLPVAPRMSQQFPVQHSLDFSKPPPNIMTPLMPTPIVHFPRQQYLGIPRSNPASTVFGQTSHGGYSSTGPSFYHHQNPIFCMFPHPPGSFV